MGYSHLEVLVEERSMYVALQSLIPKIAGDISLNFHVFDGKHNLLRRLESRMLGYAAMLKSWTDAAIVVVVDEDRKDCFGLKGELEKAAHTAGLGTLTTPKRGKSHVLNRIAVEELEAWFFGDINAIVSAYPGVSPNLGQKEKYRDSDAIRGGTWENLEKILQRAGHHKGGLEKVRAAREISQHMNLQMNRSRSFQVFYAGLLEIIS